MRRDHGRRTPSGCPRFSTAFYDSSSSILRAAVWLLKAEIHTMSASTQVDAVGIPYSRLGTCFSKSITGPGFLMGSQTLSTFLPGSSRRAVCCDELGVPKGARPQTVVIRSRQVVGTPTAHSAGLLADLWGLVEDKTDRGSVVIGRPARSEKTGVALLPSSADRLGGRATHRPRL